MWLVFSRLATTILMASGVAMGAHTAELHEKIVGEFIPLRESSPIFSDVDSRDVESMGIDFVRKQSLIEQKLSHESHKTRCEAWKLAVKSAFGSRLLRVTCGDPTISAIADIWRSYEVRLNKHFSKTMKDVRFVGCQTYSNGKILLSLEKGDSLGSFRESAKGEEFTSFAKGDTEKLNMAVLAARREHVQLKQSLLDDLRKDLGARFVYLKCPTEYQIEDIRYGISGKPLGFWPVLDCTVYHD